MSNPIRATCPGCQVAVKANPRYAGKKVKCPKCGSGIPIPGAGDKAKRRKTTSHKGTKRSPTPRVEEEIRDSDLETVLENIEDYEVPEDEFEDYEDYDADETEPGLRRTRTARRSKVDNSVKGLWRDGKIVVMAHGAKMPKRCFKSGATDVTKKRIELGYSPPAATLGAITMGVLTAAATGVAITANRYRKVELDIYYSKSWKKRRLLRALIGLGICAAGGGLFYLSLTQMICLLTVIGFFCIVGGLIFAGTGDHISAQKIDDQFVRIRGAGKHFLETLPEWKKQSRKRNR